jgi:hypothetical protein
MEYEDFNKVYEVERIMEYRKWCGKIPHITFPNDWKVQVIPPFRGAVVRFKIKKGDANVSIYLDCYDRLGCYGQPYWEVYPHENDVFRCDMEDTETLLKAIAESIAEQ